MATVRRRTPEARLRREAQKMDKLALEALRELVEAKEGPPPIRLAAAREILDRGHGRPKLGAPTDEAEEGGLTVIVKRYSELTPGERPNKGQGDS